MTGTAVAVIQAESLRHNLRVVRSLAPGCPVLAVIKANAYGHGLVSAARILEGADGFAVARLDEALVLRAAGIAGRIVVLSGMLSTDDARFAGTSDLDVVVHDPVQVDTLERAGAAGPRNVWLKVDTGMGRLGVEPSAVPGLVARLRICLGASGNLRLMTHLASADDPASDVTEAQLAVFREVRRNWPADISIANSAAILAYPGAHETPGTGDIPPVGRNWVRPGLMLYGASPLPDKPAASLGLRPAMSFESRLIAVRPMPRGRHVGYGGDWTAGRDTVVGVAAVGYADGYPWHSSRGTPVLVNGSRARVIGRVSMDLISIDLTGIEARPGDRVVLWGEGLPVEEVARCAGTIAYELLAAIGARVVRQVDDRA
ncbi:MAG: alanine racemase [Gammaproteobacteria bacterium]|nr:alanine racemase [Gammaproteobacteria bacterium]